MGRHLYFWHCFMILCIGISPEKPWGSLCSGSRAVLGIFLPPWEIPNWPRQTLGALPSQPSLQPLVGGRRRGNSHLLANLEQCLRATGKPLQIRAAWRLLVQALHWAQDLGIRSCFSYRIVEQARSPAVHRTWGLWLFLDHKKTTTRRVSHVWAVLSRLICHNK